MNYVLTAEQMKRGEAACVEREKIAYSALMLRAGRECAAWIIKRYQRGKVLVLCGKGKNGGDGFVLADALGQAGFSVTVLLTHGLPKAEDARLFYEKLNKEFVPVFEYGRDAENLLNGLAAFDLIAECVFGTGFSGAFDEKTRALFRRINKAAGVRVAVDVPAGVDCDRAMADPDAFRADITLAVSDRKKGHLFFPARAFCGKTILADIGITAEDCEKAGYVATAFSSDDAVRSLLPHRPPNGNKGTFGHALCICGSMRMQGAAVLSAKGALRMGAGLVTVAFPEKAYPAVAPKLTESLLLPLACDEKGFFAEGALEELQNATEKASAVLSGCGLGLTKDTKKIVFQCIQNCNKPLVLDADGINAVAENINVLKAAKAPLVLTPHPGEMSRLTGKSIAEILQNPVEIAKEFATVYGVTLVLKIPSTVICSSRGEVHINTTGNNLLAKGGSGDLLAGMTVSLLAQGMGSFDAARCAVYLHGLLADRTEGLSTRCTLPGDLADTMPRLLSDF